MNKAIHKVDTMTLSIVFLNYNRLSETRYTVEHLRKLLGERQDIEVIAVDNASKDGTREFLQKQVDWLTLITLEENTGIAGYNAGFKQAKGKYVLVLDDDSHPVDNLTLDRIINHFNTQQQLGIIACRIETLEGQLTPSWHLPKRDKPGTSMAFVGCGFAIRRDLFEKIGWYPAEFFLYQNEVEVAIRTLCQHYTIFYDPDCRVVHRQSSHLHMNWRRVYYPTRNTIWIIRKYFPFPLSVYLITSRLCMGLIRALQARELGWYYRAVKEAFAYPIVPDVLSQSLLKQLKPFSRQNSLFHQLLGWW